MAVFDGKPLTCFWLMIIGSRSGLPFTGLHLPMHHSLLIAALALLAFVRPQHAAQDAGRGSKEGQVGVPPAQPPPQEPAPKPPEDPAQQATPAPAALALPSPDQLIADCRSACGAPEKIASLKGVAIRASLPLPSGETYLEILSTRSGSFRFTQRGVEQPGVSVYFDGKVGWIVYSDTRRELIDEFTLQRGRHQFNAMFPFWHVMFPEERFQAMETIEKSQFNEHECFKVRLHDEESRNMQRFAFFDVDEKLMRGMSVTQETPTGVVTVQFKFEEWASFEDVKVFTKLSIDQPTQPIVITYTHVEFNTVDESVFEQPPDVKEMVEKRDAPPPPPVEIDDAEPTAPDEAPAASSEPNEND